MLEVGRTPWSAADALVGLLVFSLDLEVRVQGDPRGPGGPPHLLSKSSFPWIAGIKERP